LFKPFQSKIITNSFQKLHDQVTLKGSGCGTNDKAI